MNPGVPVKRRTRPRGPLPNWQPSTLRQRGIVADLLALYRSHADNDLLPRGPRGAFYDLRPDGLGHGVTYRKPDKQHPQKQFGPMEASPENVREVLVLMRRAEMIPEHWVADGRAPDAISARGWDNVEEFVNAQLADIRSAPANFWLDRQLGQPLHVEILCEAADLMARVARTIRPYGVTVYSGGGFDGLKGKRAFAERAMEREVPTIVLNIGDRDKHGEDIYLAAAEDALAWAVADGGRGVVAEIDRPVSRPAVTGPGLWFQRIALTTEQAAILGVLDADGKAEADAIPVPVLDRWLIEAIETLQVTDIREALLASEAEERETIPARLRLALDEEAS